ncbi:Hsp20/alpha crystallin family protein [Halobaculum roseum]|uniref:Hsp20/alpha crystallin family protein n=1 Tax=Halobaculum roseum TaxID=2175149 RepID=A0ABD5MTG9_9EURY|nr:Hsp20/alpha crystallin family protein [Halobaculum roseum]QZY04519.1 Hsp20/alpha crystallin family protein [Halobaculum roseum]
MSSFPFNETQVESRGGETSQATDWSVTQSTQEPTFQPNQQRFAYPDVDIVDAGDSVIAYVDLPGYDADDIRVRIDQQTLLIDATREEEIGETDTVVARERPTTVERMVTLPAVVRAGGAEAELNDGVCMISLPKAATDRYEEIHVKGE